MSIAMRTTPTRASGLSSFTLQLTKARFAGREGESLLYFAAIGAYIICSALALTVAGGTWMFFNRWQHPTGLLADLVRLDDTFDVVLMFYFVLAVIACVLLVPAMANLASGAAVLGARGRERRLSALRLIGLSAADVTKMSLIDTLIQATIGTVVGLVIYFVTLPAWGRLEMLATAVQPGEMMLPWFLLVSVCLSVIVVGVVAAWWGLRQVRVSPLGVARRTVRPALRFWRLVVSVVVITGAGIALNMLQIGRGLAPYLFMAALMLVVIGGLNLLGPWLLQQVSRLLAQLPSPSIIWAARRVQADPRTTWNRVSGIMLLSLIGGYVALMPIELNQDQTFAEAATFVQASQLDFTKGTVITLAVGFLLTATSILITQASAVFERAEQTRAMRKVGSSTRFLSAVMWLETLGPLTMATVLGAAAGFGLAWPMFNLARKQFDMQVDSTVGVMAVVLVTGIVLAVLALVACQFLQRQVLAEQRRAND